MTMLQETGTWTQVCRLTDIPRAGSRLIRHPQGDIALFRTHDDQVFALENRCPHKGGPLADGLVHGCQVTCPLHNWTLDLSTGQALPPDEGEVKTWPVKLADGLVFLAFS